MTAAEFQDLGNFFQKLNDSKTLKWWAIAAGIGAVLDGLHVLWLAFRYLAGRL